MKPATTTKKFASQRGHFSPAPVTDFRNYNTDVRLDGRFKIMYNNPKDAPKNASETVSGQELLEEMERIAGTREKGNVLARMSIVIL